MKWICPRRILLVSEDAMTYAMTTEAVRIELGRVVVEGDLHMPAEAAGWSA